MSESLIKLAYVCIYVCVNVCTCLACVFQASRGVSQLICHRKLSATTEKDIYREREGDWHKLISTLIPISDSTIYYKGLSEQTNEKKRTHDTQRKEQI